jgi:hypothetical protein
MYLLVSTYGARYWRLDYRFAEKRRTLAIGVYPAVALSEARTRRDDARASLAKGIEERETLPVTSDEKRTLPIARRCKG